MNFFPILLFLFYFRLFFWALCFILHCVCVDSKHKRIENLIITEKTFTLLFFKCSSVVQKILFFGPNSNNLVQKQNKTKQLHKDCIKHTSERDREEKIGRQMKPHHGYGFNRSHNIVSLLFSQLSSLSPSLPMVSSVQKRSGI